MERTIPTKRLTGALFCFFALIPWVSFGLNGLDSQPWPILFGMIFLASCGPVIRAPANTQVAVLLVGVGFIFSAIASNEFMGFAVVRAVGNYVAIFTAYVAFYNYLIRYGFPWRIFVWVNVIWLIMAPVELMAPSVVEAISPLRTTRDRGVTSLAPEPTFFAIYLFFSSWLLLAACDFRPNKKITLLILANAAALVLLAKSTMGVMFVGIAAGAFAWYRLIPLRLTRRGVGWMVVALAIGIVAVVYAGDSLAQSRLVRVYSYLSETSFRQILMWDASINQRLEAVVLSLHGAWHNWLWPSGFDTFLETRDEVNVYYDGLFWYPTTSYKIMSWIGAMVYELGIFGIVALALMVRGAHDHTRLSRVNLALLFVILLTAIPPSFPMAPMLLALVAARKKSRAPLPLSTSYGEPLKGWEVSAHTPAE